MPEDSRMDQSIRLHRIPIDHLHTNQKRKLRMNDTIKIGLDYLNCQIENEIYHVFREQRVTICLLVLKSGFSIIGTSAVANERDFNEEYGRKIAYEDARNKLIEFEVYAIKKNRQ